jgi:hypothetical protein
MISTLSDFCLAELTLGPKNCGLQIILPQAAANSPSTGTPVPFLILPSAVSDPFVIHD